MQRLPDFHVSPYLDCAHFPLLLTEMVVVKRQGTPIGPLFIVLLVFALMANTEIAEPSMSATTVISHPAFFTTKTQYVLPPQKYFIPSSWRRYQLSQLINKVLSLDQPIPFDFLIQGDVLTGSIAEWCAERGIVGEEETLEIEYIESLMPPQRMTCIPQEDWISSVSCQVANNILAGSYDSNVYVFDASKKPVYTISGHTAPVTSICWVGNDRLVASASQDCTARLTRVFDIESNSESANHAKTLASLHLHTAPLSSIAANKDGTMLVTASWDTVIGIWNTSVPESDEVPLEEVIETRKKRRKVATEEEERPVRKGPEEVMKSHTNRIMRALFSPLPSSNNLVYSCGLDSTIRTWDTSSALCTSTMTLSEKPFTDIAIQSNGNTIVASSTDRTVSVFDLRLSNTSSKALMSFAHSSLPSSLASHPTDDYRVMSGSYDGIVRIWDTRSPKITVAHFKSDKGGKILSVDWQRGGLGALGGEDGVEVWKIAESAQN